VTLEKTVIRASRTNRRNKHRMITLMVATLSLLVVAFVLGCKFQLFALFRQQHRDIRVEVMWDDRGPTPMGEKGYTPQGMTWVDGKIIWANTWKNRRSRVYEIDPNTMEILRSFDMPNRAVHASGLAWDKKHLWAVDHISNRAYCIDLQASLASSKIKLIGEFDTTFQGTSACCIVELDGRTYLAISDFMHTKKTIFVRPEEAITAGTAAEAIEFSYRNEGFSQGLEFARGFLWESENKIGIDVINKMSLTKLRETGDARKATIAQYNAPSKGVEDLAWDGRYMWTSDESLFRFFRTNLEEPSPKANKMKK